MLLDYTKDVAYICPECAQINIKRLNIFQFSGNRETVLECSNSCGHVCVTIKPFKAQYKIEAKCPICGGRHLFDIKKAVFWNSPFLSFKCPASGFDIYFLGNNKNVVAAVKEQEALFEELSEMTEKVIDEKNLLEHMFGWIENMSNTGRMYCSCGSRDISMDMKKDSIVLRCRSCGASKVMYPVDECVTFLINAKSIVLDCPAKK
ncbi:MAG: hypothetical protein N2171_04180 [Clostridia bacterium]|nr:hypothetical protein [Clostridia bacterium]